MKTRSATSRLLTIIASLGSLVTASCNKDVPEPVPNTFPVPTGTSIGGLLANDTGLSLMRAAVVRAGLMTQLQDNSRTFTLFAPDNAAFAASGIRTVADIEAMPMSTLVPLVQYHLSPQKLTSSMIPRDKVSYPYPSTLNPSSATSPLSRSFLYPSRKNGAWVNNAPVKSFDMESANGVIHRLGGVLEPPLRTLWDRIGTDPEMIYLRGTILKADSGLASTDSRSLVYLLSNTASDLTFFVPQDRTFVTFYSILFRDKLISLGYPVDEAIFQAAAWALNPSFFNGNWLYYFISAKSLRELVLYHLLAGRFFQNNFSIVGDSYETLLRGESNTHHGLLYITADFWAGQSVLPTVKIRRSSSSYPVTVGSYWPANEHFINGVIHTVSSVIVPL
jgi:uncharacterized surface protein with fasciclin (FAS1) repeats